MQPYNIVNDEGFHQMLKVIEPCYLPPDRKTIANTYFPKLYEAEREKVQANLQNAKSFTITTDFTSQVFIHCFDNALLKQ